MDHDLDKAFQEFQRILKRHPVLVVGTGTSCALDRKFGMEALANALITSVHPEQQTESRQWEQVVEALHKNHGLEEALESVTERESGLVEKIVDATGSFVAEVDRQYAWDIATGKIPAPLSGLLKKLVDGLPPANPVQHLVTPNYDMLIEHTCDALEIAFTDGFSAGSTSRRDWNSAHHLMLARTREPRGKSYIEVTRYKPHVRLYKVHGSINWFQDGSESRLLRCDRITDDGRVPPGWRRAIITPGNSKLSKAGLHREWFAPADEAIRRADAFLIVGYGFNDDHIQKEIVNKLTSQGCPGIIVTRDWSEKIETLVRSSPDVWAVYQQPDHGKTGAMIAGPGHANPPLYCQDLDLWDISAFVEAVM